MDLAFLQQFISAIRIILLHLLYCRCDTLKYVHILGIVILEEKVYFPYTVEKCQVKLKNVK